MDNQKRAAQFERNPRTHAEHRREVFWQITLPLVIGMLLVLAAVVVIIISTVQPVTDVGRWADVSLMWLILPSLFLAFILLAILIGLIVLISYLLRLIPRYALIVQLYIEQAKGKISQIFNLSVEPILRVEAIWAAVRYASRLCKKETQAK
ncbi:MAG: hypothetical protein WAV05_03630 [Anaerolineales bacterium]